MNDNSIYIVTAVIAVIFAFIVFYLWRLDKKLTALEKEIKKDRSK